MVKLTVTPGSLVLGYTADPRDVIRRSHLVKVPVYYLVGPLAEDNFEAALDVINMLKPGSIMDLKRLDRESVALPRANQPNNDRSQSISNQSGTFAIPTKAG